MPCRIPWRCLFGCRRKFFLKSEVLNAVINGVDACNELGQPALGPLIMRGSLYRIEDECETIERVRLSRTKGIGRCFETERRSCEWINR
jgi:hypothetical protein